MISLKHILLEGMTVDVADTIFADFGVPNASSLDKSKLKDFYIALVKKHHPDAGGRNSDMQYINAAYDVLKSSYGKMHGHEHWPYGSDDESWPNDPSQDDYDGNAGWAQAGWSGGAPFRSDIHKKSFEDLNFCKKTAWEISGRPPFTKSNEYSIWNWDGAYFRGLFSVYAIPEKLFEISKMMQVWDRWFKSEAVFFTNKKDPNKIYLVNLRGKEVSPPKEFEHESFNSNAGNDQSFVNFLRKNL